MPLRPSRNLILAAVLATLAAVPAPRVRAQSSPASELDLKVALLYNFAKFVEWPPEVLPAGEAITICVVGDKILRASLETALKGRSVDGHDVVASDVAANGAVGKCHVVYAPRISEASRQSLVKAASGLPVFTVSDQDRFAERGGIANFYREGDRMRIAVNVDLARKHRLVVSSKLLGLATIVRSAP